MTYKDIIKLLNIYFNRICILIINSFMQMIELKEEIKADIEKLVEEINKYNEEIENAIIEMIEYKEKLTNECQELKNKKDLKLKNIYQIINDK
ncbi:hypothetical protein H311_01279 [Anncaliia algerae PRA109]|nr:hypothetical protein H311_01279 [Anncaliia algerae PRA109]